MTNHQDKELSSESLAILKMHSITWKAIVAVLDEVMPEWLQPKDSAKDCAVNAIRALAASPQLPVAQTAQAIPDEVLVDVARKTGLRGYLMGVNAQHAHEILRRFVNELALYAAPPTQVIAVEADIYKQRYEFIKTMPKEMLLFWRGAYGCDDGALDAAMNNPDHVATMSATAPSQGAKQ